MIEDFVANAYPYFQIVCIVVSILIGIDILRSWATRFNAWRNRGKHDKEFADFLGLLERSVAAEEKHNEVGAKLAEVGDKLTEARRPQPVDAPKFLH